MTFSKQHPFLESLRQLCVKNPISIKWLLAPSHRIGLAWVDAVAESGQPVANLQVVTLVGLARNLIRYDIEKYGFRFSNQTCEQNILGRALSAICQDRQGYISLLRPTESLVVALHRSVSDLRMSGLSQAQIDPEAFEVRVKGKELLRLKQQYDRMLKQDRWVDEAESLCKAAQLIRQNPSVLPKNLLFIKPKDMILEGLAQDFWLAFPKTARISLPNEEQKQIPLPLSTTSDKFNMRAIREIYRALGFATEIREVIRRCLETQISFDQVEILYTDYTTYVPAMYELFLADSIPATFSEGIPARFFRPGRALLTWLHWIKQGRKIAIAHQMRLEGLLKENSDLDESEDLSSASLRKILATAKHFLSWQARGSGESEEYSREELLRKIQEQIDCLSEDEKPVWLDIWAWLERLPHSVRVSGEGPRPGHLYVTPLNAGGHSGRLHTFILGLDNNRYPGPILQDPFLLDDEKSKLSKQLQTSRDRMHEKTKAFQALMDRLPGKAYLSYSCHQLQDERDLFPAQQINLAQSPEAESGQFCTRSTSGQNIATYGFTPSSLEKCLNQPEWWLYRLCADQPIKDPMSWVMDCYPHLEQAERAKKARESNLFTEYDGYVPEAGLRYNPFESSGTVLSAASLETMGNCPMEFFFRYVLEVDLPSIYQKPPRGWLDSMSRGSLLHAVFCEFMETLQKTGKPPRLDRDWNLMQKILSSHLEQQKTKTAPTDLYTLEQEIEQMESMASIFLKDQESFCIDYEPVWMEVFAGDARSPCENSLGSNAPIVIPLPSGRTIQVKGKIDRVDRDRNDPLSFSVIDYKTGSAWKYRQDPPFHQGRILQNALYVRLVEAMLHDEVSRSAKVKRFIYYFPSKTECGFHLCFDEVDLAKGLDHIELLSQLIAMGSFPFTDDPKDIAKSEYRFCFGDVQKCASNVGQKIINPKNRQLEPFRSLRIPQGKDQPV